jgi:hypothetical protein
MRVRFANGSLELEALGAHFVDGQTLEVDGIVGGLIAELGGGYDDPHFNNTYVEFYWPGDRRSVRCSHF